jgi:diguanylate cyclase (GGDEF)-like protein
MTSRNGGIIRSDEAEPSSTHIALADFAYQPIISTSSLRVHGFEALARFPDGTPGICDLLDEAAAAGTLRAMDVALLRKAIGKFAGFTPACTTRLFCNIDNRTYEGSPPTADRLDDLIAGSGMKASNLCLEISERKPVQSPNNLLQTVQLLSAMGTRIALDDFGVGMSGLHMLMTIEPDYVKIDRVFIDDLAGNARKQAIVAKLCGLAHALGFLTVAEGVETESDFRMARDLGCDLAQGYCIARPTTRLGDLAMSYGRTLGELAEPKMNPRVAELLTPMTTLLVDEPLSTAVDAFKLTPELRLIPVTDREGLVMGALMEEDIRRYLLSDFGPALLANKGFAPRVGQLVRRFPTGEAHGSIEAIVNSYVAAESACGLILANDGRYAGYLSNHALLRLAAEREVSVARDQNPLTQLPGNRSIARHIDEVLLRSGAQTLTFLDFDNFKAFNDCYGFAAGDRALMMLADLLRGLETMAAAFVGHVGGDDFFLSLARGEQESGSVVRTLCAKFAADAASLYSPAHRAAGGIHAPDRFGDERFFPLLRVSASMLHLPVARAHLTAAMVNDQLAAGKQMAKMAATGIATVRLPENGVGALVERLTASA